MRTVPMMTAAIPNPPPSGFQSCVVTKLKPALRKASQARYVRKVPTITMRTSTRLPPLRAMPRNSLSAGPAFATSRRLACGAPVDGRHRVVGERPLTWYPRPADHVQPAPVVQGHNAVRAPSEFRDRPPRPLVRDEAGRGAPEFPVVRTHQAPSVPRRLAEDLKPCLGHTSNLPDRRPAAERETVNSRRTCVTGTFSAAGRRP